MLFLIWNRVAPLHFQSSYQYHIYPFFRATLAPIVDIIPFPVLYLFTLGIVLWLLCILCHFFKRDWDLGFISLVKGSMFLFTSFYIFWGFNYQLPTFVDRLEIEVADPTDTWIINTLDLQAKKLNQIVETISCEQEFTLKNPEMNDLIQQKLSQLNIHLSSPYQLHNEVVVQSLISGALLRFEATGIYLSQTFQGHIDDAMHCVQKPFTTVHETLHGYGVTEESDCNLLAYLVLSKSDNTFAKFSAELALFRYLAFEGLAINPEYYKSFRTELHPNLIYHLDQINLQLRKYPPLFEGTKDIIYDAYLRGNGIQEGVKNYSYFVKVLYTMEQNGLLNL